MIERFATEEVVIERKVLDEYSEVESVTRYRVRGMFQHAVRVIYAPEGARVSSNALLLLPPEAEIDVGDYVIREGQRLRAVRVDKIYTPPAGDGRTATVSHVEVWLV